MAKITKNGISLSSSSGSGDATISVTGGSYYGRLPRTATFTISGTGVTGNKTVTVTQSARALFCTPYETGHTVNASGSSSLVIRGVSNAYSLKFQSSTLKIDNYKVGGTNVINGESVTDPYGKYDHYEWEITVTVPSTESLTDIKHKISIQISADAQTYIDSSEVTITQTKASAFLNVLNQNGGSALSTITIDANGNASSFYIDSNTSWTIS